MAGVVKCVSVMKDTGLRLTRMAFQYLLRAPRQEAIASSEGEVGVVSGEGGEEVGVVTSEGESNEEGVASSDDISRLLDHIKVLVAMGHIPHSPTYIHMSLRGRPCRQACVTRCVCTSWTEASLGGYLT